MELALSPQIHSTQYQSFLEKLKQARLDAGLTQVDVAQALGKHQSYISKCESGERRVDFVELLDFARIYQKPLEYFKL
jgi:transcriptional regulator with XRE-family HTH domain